MVPLKKLLAHTSPFQSEPQACGAYSALDALTAYYRSLSNPTALTEQNGADYVSDDARRNRPCTGSVNLPCVWRNRADQ